MTRSFSSADASADFLVVVVLSLVVVLLCFSCVLGGCEVRFGARSVRVLNGRRRASTPLYRVLGLPCRRVQQGCVCSKTAVLDVFQPSIDRSSMGAFRPFPPSFLPSASNRGWACIWFQREFVPPTRLGWSLADAWGVRQGEGGGVFGFALESLRRLERQV